jgi:hypothetical protein
MRLTLWQQFSSNHSASFTIVGVFDTAERAEEIAQELRDILREISTWWEQFDIGQQSEIEESLRKAGELTPPEAALEQRYGLGWTTSYPNHKPYPLDWVKGQYALDAVSTFRNYVFISPTGNTWEGAKPFDSLLRAWGGSVRARVEEVSELSVTFTCAMPDEVSAVALEGKTRAGTQNVRIPGLGNTPYGLVMRDGCKVMLGDVSLVWAGIRTPIPQTFQKILTFLEAQGCTEIDVEFSENYDV